MKIVLFFLKFVALVIVAGGMFALGIIGVLYMLPMFAFSPVSGIGVVALLVGGVILLERLVSRVVRKLLILSRQKVQLHAEDELKS